MLDAHIFPVFVSFQIFKLPLAKFFVFFEYCRGKFVNKFKSVYGRRSRQTVYKSAKILSAKFLLSFAERFATCGKVVSITNVFTKLNTNNFWCLIFQNFINSDFKSFRR